MIKKLFTYSFILIALVAVVAFFVQPSGPAMATAEAVVSAVMFKGEESPEMEGMYKKQPEYKAVVECIGWALDEQGWTQYQHDALMTMTASTGNLANINQHEYTEAQLMEKVGPVFTASNSCL